MRTELTWQGKVDGMHGRMKLLVEEREIMQRESLSLQKQLDYYKVRQPRNKTNNRVKRNHYKRK